MNWQERETEAFIKMLNATNFKFNQNTANCPKCGMNIDVDIALYNCGKVICDTCYLEEQNQIAK